MLSPKKKLKIVLRQFELFLCFGLSLCLSTVTVNLQTNKVLLMLPIKADRMDNGRRVLQLTAARVLVVSLQASTALQNREQALDDVAEEIECKLELTGAVAVDDKLQVHSSTPAACRYAVLHSLLGGCGQLVSIRISHSLVFVAAVCTKIAAAQSSQGMQMGLYPKDWNLASRHLHVRIEAFAGATVRVFCARDSRANTSSETGRMGLVL